MRTAKARFVPRIRAVWSGHSLSAYWINGYYRLQSTLFIQTFDTTTKFVIMTIWMSRHIRSVGDGEGEIMQKHCIKSSSNICFGYLLESPQRGDSNKYPKHMFYEEIRIKQGLFIHIILSIKNSLQQQIHYNGNIFWNKCYRCNEGSLYIDKNRP